MFLLSLLLSLLLDIENSFTLGFELFCKFELFDLIPVVEGVFLLFFEFFFLELLFVQLVEKQQKKENFFFSFFPSFSISIFNLI